MGSVVIQQTSGQCRLCGKSFARPGMSRHLRACPRRAAGEGEPDALLLALRHPPPGRLARASSAHPTSGGPATESSSAGERRSGLGAPAWVLGGGAVTVEAFLLWVRSGRPGGWVVVRCRRGHLYRTLWIPGASLTSLRLGWWRLQWCPVGRHVSLVAPVREAALDEDERRRAHEARDLPLP